jgi:hypothetical protein
MDFINYLLAVFAAAFRLSVDTTQVVLFLGIIALELVAIFAPPSLKPTVLAVSARLTTGRVALIALIAVIATRLLLAPYWVWEDEHAARLLAESKIAPSAQPAQRDPDGVYQLGHLVGRVSGAIENLSTSQIHFSEITAGGNFNPKTEFEYRDFKLRIVRVSAATSADMSGVKNMRFINVDTEVLGQR